MSFTEEEVVVMRDRLPGCFGSLITYDAKNDLCKRCKARERCAAKARESGVNIGEPAMRLIKSRGLGYAITLSGVSARAKATIVSFLDAGIDPASEIQAGRNPFDRGPDYLKSAGDLLVQGRYSRERLEALLRARHPYWSKNTVRRYLTLTSEIIGVLSTARTT